MRLRDSLILALVDKGILAVLALVAGYWLNTRLNKFQAEKTEALQPLIQRAKARLPAYQALWGMLAITSPTLDHDLTEPERVALDADLRSWYYRDGNGLFLSHSAATILLDARKKLRDSETTSDSIKKVMSGLRTQLKADLSVYDTLERKLEIDIA